MNWKHDELQGDLAETRKANGEIVAEKLAIGSWGGGGQIDVFALKPSWSAPNPTVYEVKISRADFMGDTQSGKYRKYLPFCRRLYFAVPSGMLTKAEVPDGMGLIVRGDNGWHTVKAPRVQQVEPENFHTVTYALLLNQHPAPWRKPSREQRIRRLHSVAEINQYASELSGRVRNALEAGDRAERDHDLARQLLIRELGADPETDNRNLASLAHEVLNRAPLARMPIAPLERTLRILGDQVGRAQEQLAALNGACADRLGDER